ncbi:MAG: acyltransferase [Alcanivoracaceae bacterium]|nr:acyltransferase [Alcanivoracaceae bacterium]
MSKTDTHFSPNRYTAIDALRGIAALLVVWHHSSESFINIADIAQQGSYLADIAKEYDFGRIGIICFFLISGFVIPSSFKLAGKNPLKTFAIHRFFRLYPAYWLSLVAIIVYQLLMNIEIKPATVIANTSMLQSFFSQPHLIGLYWTLQIELIFYTLCALLFYLGILNNTKIVFNIILAFFLLFVVLQSIAALTSIDLSISKEFQLLPYLLSTMFLGAFYRKIYDGKIADKQLVTYTLLASLMCFGLPLFLLISAIMGYELTEHSFRFGAAHTLAFILFYAGLVLLKKTPKALLWLGAISYSLYLFHPIVLQILMQIIIKSNISYLHGLHLSIYMTITTIISIIMASFIYIILEKPAIRLGRKLSK